MRLALHGEKRKHEETEDEINFLAARPYTDDAADFTHNINLELAILHLGAARYLMIQHAGRDKEYKYDRLHNADSAYRNKTSVLLAIFDRRRLLRSHTFPNCHQPEQHSPRQSLDCVQRPVEKYAVAARTKCTTQRPKTRRRDEEWG